MRNTTIGVSVHKQKLPLLYDVISTQGRKLETRLIYFMGRCERYRYMPSTFSVNQSA